MYSQKTKTMLVKEVIKELKNVSHIYSYVKFNKNHGEYVRVMKIELLNEILKNMDENSKIKCEIDTEQGVAYIGG